ncbi:MAG: selenocysteine-specific translation elongation factor [Myxococcota bacterium]|nr:selenocysteine-specific translation elongation factor [Myxococcota bacterium]
MKRFILGTAGHVDHGKTALVRALTGIECDTHREEKTRGITINLGFAHLDLNDQVSLGIVDVPGHRDFIHTMVSGASGIDLALLVVAADSGVMPQTQEHLEIMQALGIRAGLVAVTKVDLVDDDIAELACEEIEALLEGTFLEGCPIMRVSAVTGEGMEALKNALDDTARGLEERPLGHVFRLYPDRIFSVSGFGSVVTGSVLGGAIQSGDTVYLLPTQKKLRVRRIERHGTETDQVLAGDRASMNLVGLNREDFSRGMAIADRMLSHTDRVDAKLRLFAHSRDFGTWTQVVFHLATYEKQAKVHLIHPDKLKGGEEGLVQIHLTEPCVLQFGDRFVIRSTSSDITLGGGEIIDPAPLHHRRRTAKVVDLMSKISAGKLPEIIAVEIKKHRAPLSADEIAAALNISRSDVSDMVAEGLPDHLVSYTQDNRLFLDLRDVRDQLTDKIVALLTSHHKQNPLDEKGRTTEEMMGMFGIKRGSSAETVFRLMLSELEKAQSIRSLDHTWVLTGHRVTLTPDQKKNIAMVEASLASAGMAVLSMTVLKEQIGAKGIGESELKQILRYLVATHRAHTVEGEYLHATHVDRARQALLKSLKKKPDGLSVGQFRDLLGGSRRLAMLLFQLFETQGIIGRVNDIRVLTKKGNSLVDEITD